ncbi:hypothetical protein TVAG_075300 [Trichomonas vaginalis G3]|uniref:Uncharacterized protein n=1 Tax=Trichomonas vaginalis (strain ATCC PRA-98 / G3) TaxID=412133 RepID=A2FED7_TRIV3|nr:protein ubiquitination [Trichomonas vaginalis G3]EAX96724.1 hypothetical protein TVAG_075300 [Trichomonas vaginalis G3]KAI5521689.1 protein ubiquitination [Trichomonas vaginalis G3]|eukprot:XP_001309654.1 hypothetical protein [Trichomonas vaginalis G3]
MSSMDNTVNNGKNKKYLLQGGHDPYLILLKACEEGDYETIKFACEHGYLPKMPSMYMNKKFELYKQVNFFSSFMATHSLESIKYMFTQPNVDIDSLDSTPYHHAVLNEDVEVTKYLISIGKFDINAKEPFGAFPIHYAALNKNVEVFKLLCTLPNIDINAMDKRKLTPLHYAVLINNIEVVRYLCSLPNIDINAMDSDNHTAAYHAALNDYVEIIRILSQKA